jgi:cell division protease FtsH
MVTRYGFSDLGPQALDGDGSEVFLGRDWLRAQPHYSEITGRRIDAQVRQLARLAQDEAVALLAPRRALMDTLVDLLIAEETLDGERFRGLVNADDQAALSSTGQVAAEADVETAQVGV